MPAGNDFTGNALTGLLSSAESRTLHGVLMPPRRTFRRKTKQRPWPQARLADRESRDESRPTCPPGSMFETDRFRRFEYRKRNPQTWSVAEKRCTECACPCGTLQDNRGDERFCPARGGVQFIHGIRPDWHCFVDHIHGQPGRCAGKDSGRGGKICGRSGPCR